MLMRMCVHQQLQSYCADSGNFSGLACYNWRDLCLVGPWKHCFRFCLFPSLWGQPKEAGQVLAVLCRFVGVRDLGSNYYPFTSARPGNKLVTKGFFRKLLNAANLNDYAT